MFTAEVSNKSDLLAETLISKFIKFQARTLRDFSVYSQHPRLCLWLKPKGLYLGLSKNVDFMIITKLILINTF